jgi:zinc transporter, ZIP family
MLLAGFWGFVAGSALLVGGLLALYRPWSVRAIGLFMAFGSGVLISSVAFDLVDEALDLAGGAPTTLGMTAGALTFFGGDLLLERRGRAHRRRAHRPSDADRPAGDDDQGAADGNPLAIVLGAVLDGIPESAAIGISLLESGRVGGTFVVAVFLSNVPEALSATAGLARSGRPPGRIMRMWAAVAVVSTLAAAIGYVALDGASDGARAALSAYAAGAVLTMVASTMLPEAHREGGSVSGLVTSGGFLLAVLIGSLAQTA